jgi:hypothetical protein
VIAGHHDGVRSHGRTVVERHVASDQVPFDWTGAIGTIVTRSFTKSSLVHQTLTPADRLQKSPRMNWRSLPPAIEQPDAMCEHLPMRTRVEK